MEFININGAVSKAGAAAIKADNHSYRYGAGLFETMKLKNGKILLTDLHFERLFASLSLLKFKTPAFFTRQKLEKEIAELCTKNNCGELARVRLSVSAGQGGLYEGEEEFQYIIECWPIKDQANEINDQGLLIDIFPFARKSCDVFSNLKSASHLPYVMAARYAKENGFDDCLLLNAYERICDSTIANLFWIKDKKIFTPPFAEGCIAGVMRRYLIESAQGTSYEVQERPCEIKDLETADGIFLTNAIQGVRWVRQFRDKEYSKNTVIHDDLLKRLSGL